jgi:protein-disulfide isomerase
MLTRWPILVLISMLMLLGCGASSAQSPKEAEALRKEVEALKASQAELQKSLEEVRAFLKVVTGGKFGGPTLQGAAVEIDGAPANGTPTAPVTLIEISDYHCPFCRRHVQQTQPQLYSEYVTSGKVRHVFLHYPIEQLHPDAYRSHEAAACAGDQGKFWELHAKLFDSPLRTVEQLVPLAQSAGLDAAAFRACLESGRHGQAVRDSVARIQKLGISGTPHFLVGRTPPPGQPMKVAKIVEGAQPFSAFKTALDEVLAVK